VKKKSPWLHYDIRILKLYSSGRLEYLEPNSFIIKGNIKLDEDCKVHLIDEYRFELHTTKRSYNFLVNLIFNNS
jgi:hypothetical protein